MKLITSYTTFLLFMATMLLSACATPNGGGISVDWEIPKLTRSRQNRRFIKNMVPLPTHLLMVTGPSIPTVTTVMNTPIMT